MKLYKVNFSNRLDSSIESILVLSNEPLDVNSGSIYSACGVQFDEYCRIIHSVEIPKIKINAWDLEEHEEATNIINLMKF